MLAINEGFLPTTAEEVKYLGWDRPDFVYVCGDAYVDHPSFGAAIISRVLEAEGFRSGKVSIGHCQNETAALRLKELILAKFKDASIETHELRGLCSFYAEKGGVLVGFEKA